MKKIVALIFFLFVIAVCFFTTCKKDKAVVQESNNNPPPPTPTAVNLIANGSFEDSVGKRTAQDWYYVWNKSFSSSAMPIDTTLSPSVFTNDVPSNGGNWSYEIRESAQGGIVTFITNEVGTNIYKLNFWAKGVFPYNTHGLSTQGCIEKFSKTGPYAGTEACVNIDSTSQWKKYYLIDTLTTNATDSIAIYFYLQGCSGPPNCPPTYRLDLIELTKTKLQ